MRETLPADNRFTEEAIAFAINQQMHSLAADSIREWTHGRQAPTRRRVGVLNAGNVPFAGLQDLVAVLATGHEYLGVVSSKSPALLPAFVDDLKRQSGSVSASFASYQEMLSQAEAVIATGSDDTRQSVAEDLDVRGIDASRRLLRGQRFSVAIVDGMESEEEREGLAEDALLHEGLGCRNVAIIWAPSGLSPDPFFEAMASFRAVFPVHERTPGSLKMHQAMLAALSRPHAYGEDLEFLVSKGDPEVQVPGHVRWSEYESIADVSRWINDNRERIQTVVARHHIARKLDSEIDAVAPGEAQRPALDWRPDGVDTVSFLFGLT